LSGWPTRLKRVWDIRRPEIMDKIILRELHFMARHGVLPIETENSQHFSATV